MAIFGIIPIQSCYLPYVFMGFDILTGSDIKGNIIALLCGHLYFYLSDIIPQLNGGKDIIVAPAFLRNWLNPAIEHRSEAVRQEDELRNSLNQFINQTENQDNANEEGHPVDQEVGSMNNEQIDQTLNAEQNESQDDQESQEELHHRRGYTLNDAE